MQTAVYIVGAIFEFVGIVLAAAADLAPGARRFSRWATPRWRRFETPCGDCSIFGREER